MRQVPRQFRLVAGAMVAASLWSTSTTVARQDSGGEEGDEGSSRVFRRIRDARENLTTEQFRRLLRREGRERAREGADLAPDPNHVWLRDFPGPDRALPVEVIEQGDNFEARAAEFGIMRELSRNALWDTATLCTVSTDVQPADSGYDIVYTVSNTTSLRQNLPTLQICGHLLGLQTQYLDARFGCVWGTADATSGRPVWSPELNYPRHIYSPVIVAKDDHLAVGLSLIYDVMSLKHAIRTSWGRAGAGTRMGDAWNAKFYLDGTIGVGESRTYRVTVRYTDPADWIYTLAPYRESFQQRFGYVRYTQDMRPCFGVNMSDPLLVSETNPRGFGPYRADQNGWVLDVDRNLEHCLRMGFERVMLWAPGGCYREHQQNNFPPQMQSDWTEPMVNTASELNRFESSGVELLFWWGRSSQYPDRWDDDVLDDFDPFNLRQMRRMMDEWDLTHNRGGSGAALEFLSYMDAWKAVPWILMLKETHPGSTLLGEPSCTDIVNLFIPVFVQSDKNPQPHLLADYIVPGREMWCFLKGDHSNLERALEVVSWGMTVCTKGRDLSALDLADAIRDAQHRVE